MWGTKKNFANETGDPMRTDIYTYLIRHKRWITTCYFFALPILASLLWIATPLAADTETLEQIAEAERTVSYVGVRLKTLISSRGTRTFEEMVIHKAPDMSYGMELSAVGKRRGFGGSRDSDSHREGRRRDRGENQKNSRERDQKQWRPVRSLFSEKEIGLIAENYNLTRTESTEKIANYETDILTITPKFAGRPSQRIFFARENGTTLRVETFDAEGVLQALFVYIRINFDPETVAQKWKAFEKERRPARQRSEPISLSDAEKILKMPPVQPVYLPPGFQLQKVHRIKDRKQSVHLIYTDGLLRFSIFETTNRPKRQNMIRNRASVITLAGTTVYKHQRGPTHAFSWSGADTHFFLFGAMPTTEMQKVAESIIREAKKK